MAVRRIKTTKLDIIRCATTLFLEQGYSNTSPKQIAQALDIATGNLTYYFPTKEHLLAVLTDMLCEFQWDMMEREAGEGLSSVMAICLEIATMAAMCEQDPVAADFYLSAYQSHMCLELIRRSDMLRAKMVFRDTCIGWTEEHFAEAELLVSGIEYATLVNTGPAVTLQTRIAGAVDAVLRVYNIPSETRQLKIRKVLAMDYRQLALRVLADFKQFVAETNEHALEELLRAKQPNAQPLATGTP